MVYSRRYFLGILSLAAAGVGLDACSGTQQIEETLHPQYPLHNSRGKALIVNGDQWEFRHMENVIRAQQFLLGVGYGSEDINVLSAPYEAFSHKEVERLRYVSHQENFELPRILGPATLKNTQSSLEQMIYDIEPNQELFVYITGHGGMDEKKQHSFAQLNSVFSSHSYDELRDEDLRGMLQKQKKKYNGIVVFDGCNGEGFAEVVGRDNITAITKSQKGEVDSCVYFANEFFHTPFNGWNLRDRENLTLRDSVEYTKKALEEGGAAAHIVMRGNYNPILVPKVIPKYMIFSVFMPNSPVQSAHMPIVQQLQLDKKVMGVNNDIHYQKAMSEKKALFYLQAESCNACEEVSSLLEELLETKEKRVPIYVFSNDFDADSEKIKAGDYTQKLEQDLGISVKSFPLLLRMEQGRIVATEGFPTEAYGYGHLPDKYIQIPSRKKLDVLLNF